MGWWHEHKWQRWQARHPLPEAAWQHVCTTLPLLSGLSAPMQARLGERSWRLLYELRLSLPRDVEWSLEAHLQLAAQIALMGLGWPDRQARDALGDTREIIVVPGAFRRHVQEMDEAGVMHEFDDERAGETSWGGPVVLSLEDIKRSGDWHGFNVIIHEFAHKLDMTGNMAVDGQPALTAGIDSKTWYHTFMRAWEALQGTLERGEAPPIDDYAATHPSEFFAVCCEYFFSAPDLLDGVWPDLYALLVRYFGQNPLERLQGLKVDREDVPPPSG
ncbi:M90 family metallopeptidase [Kushneria sp. AK178]